MTYLRFDLQRDCRYLVLERDVQGLQRNGARCKVQGAMVMKSGRHLFPLSKKLTRETREIKTPKKISRGRTRKKEKSYFSRRHTRTGVPTTCRHRGRHALRANYLNRLTTFSLFGKFCGCRRQSAAKSFVYSCLVPYAVCLEPFLHLVPCTILYL